MAAWSALAASAGQAPRSSDAAASSPARGFAEVRAAAHISSAGAGGLLRGLVSLGAVTLDEATLEDWQSLEAWGLLRPLEQRRLSQRVGAVARA